ncbi:hypothetical protein BURKHO8Y_210348 [Burkholderia sp. 8Y]|nr:hypothetical protein BURKHO8Y_210348 [Burkholderia sp. 8Y]
MRSPQGRFRDGSDLIRTLYRAAWLTPCGACFLAARVSMQASQVKLPARCGEAAGTFVSRLRS